MRTRQVSRKQKESGITLLLGTVSLLFIVPMIGLVVDVGFLYATKSKLQAAVDGAALAAARALNIGQSLASQTTSAQNNAVNWFYANFPSNYFGTQNTVMGTSNVQVFNDPNNPQLRNVTVQATTQVDTFFMKWLGFGATTIGSIGNASRRTVVAMMVLDRSGSMGASCTDMVNAAKYFVGQFAENSDYLGALSFSDNYVLHSKPVQNFQTVLGYTNDSGTAAGALDNLTGNCKGGTATPGALSIAYNELYHMNLPGALNVLFLQTDGLPNTMMLNFWDSANSVAGIQGASGCTDNNNKTMAGGGFNSAAAVNNRWTPSVPAGWLDVGTAGSFFPAITGLVSQPYGADPSQGTYFILMLNPYSAQQPGAVPSNGWNASMYTTAPGCAFNGGASYNNPPTTPDLAWFPTTDVFGNQLNPATNPYKSGVTMTGSHVVSNSYSAYKAGVFNAVDNLGYRARTNMGLAANAGIGPVSIFVVGLAGNAGDQPDPILLQRLANDPNGDLYNSPTNYLPCAQEPTCIQYPNQPQGTFIWSANRTKLVQSYQAIVSQVLRLSK
jgi:Flp pilus assembly protein TadG